MTVLILLLSICISFALEISQTLNIQTRTWSNGDFFFPNFIPLLIMNKWTNRVRSISPQLRGGKSHLEGEHHYVSQTNKNDIITYKTYYGLNGRKCHI
jgi:hypothetical protein